MSHRLDERESRASSSGTRRRLTRSRSVQGSPDAVAWGLALAVLGAALAIGAVHVMSTLLLAAFMLALLGFAFATRRVERRMPPPAALAFALALVSSLQALPLPAFLLERVAPANLEIWRGAYETLGRASPSWLSPSLDPGATLLEAVKWFTYAAAFTLAAGVARRRGGQVGALIVWASALVVALVTLLHRLAGADTVFGIYAPVGEFSHSSLGPLLNANNLAGYLNLGVFCGIGLLLAPAPLIPRWAAGLGAAPLIGVALETGSRGGLVSLLLGFLLVGTMLARSSAGLVRSLQEKRRMLLAIAAVAGFGVLLAALSANHRLASGIADKSVAKLAMAGWVQPLVADFPWLGVGRGAFESAFQAYRVGKNNLVYSHPENLVAQWVAEWGIPVGVCGLVAFAWLLRPRRLGAERHPVALGVFAALCVLTAQNLVDLSLEIPAVALAAMVALGSSYGAAQPADGGVGASSRTREAWAWALVGAAAVAWVATVYVAPTPVGASRRNLEVLEKSLDMKDPQAVRSFRGDLAQVMLQHPADPYFPRLGALVAVRARDAEPMPWIDRALTLGPTSGRTHYLLASVLASWRKTEQALLELRHAATYDPDLTAPVLATALRLSRDPEVLARAAPHGEAGVGVLLAMAHSVRDDSQLQGLRVSLLRLAVERAPERLEPHLQLGRVLFARLSAADAPSGCWGASRERCAEEALREARISQRLAPLDPRGVQLEAELLLTQGDAWAAERLLSERCEKVTPRRACLLLRLQAAVKSRDDALMAAAARAAVASGCAASDDCARLQVELGDIFAGQAVHAQALLHYKRAAREEPSASVWAKLADSAERVGELSTAIEALTRLELKKRDPRLRRRIEELRARGLEPVLGLPMTGK